MLTGDYMDERRSIWVTTYPPKPIREYLFERGTLTPFLWLQTSGTGRSMYMTTYPPHTYFNKITRNNQGNVK